jgi:predicted regulator of Ras-like GTPase activity (Roadblock/LC7/MglB family)
LIPATDLEGSGSRPLPPRDERIAAVEYTVELTKQQFDQIEVILQHELIEPGVENVLLIDLAGNILIHLNNGNDDRDVYSLAALAAGHFGAVSAMAKIIGEKDFSLLFHKGEKDSIHFSCLNDDLLLVTVFGTSISLGFVRLKIDEAIKRIQKLL